MVLLRHTTTFRDLWIYGLKRLYDVEHYEISGYLSAVRWVDELGETNVKESLLLSLREEIETEEKLSMLASGKIDPKALPKEI